MAKHADGTIVINTAIETDGFKKGSKDMEAAFRKAAVNLEGVSEKIQISVEKSIQAFSKQNAAYREQEARVDSLKDKIKEAQSQKVESTAFANLNKEIDQYQRKLDAAIEKEIRFMDTGGSTKSTAYERMEYDIEVLRSKLAEAKAEKDRLIASGEAYTDADISHLTNQLVDAQDKLAQMGGKLESSYASLRQKMGEYAVGAEESAKKTNIFKMALDRLNKGARNTGSGLGGALKKFVKYGLGMASVYMLFNKIRAAITESIKNIAKFDKKTNASISGIQSSFAKLKNNITAAITPLINALAPVIIKVVNWLNEAITKLGMFIAQITGQDSYIKAKDVWKDYAAGLYDTADAAKEAQRNLSGLDEINTWSSGSGAGSGSGTSVNPDDLFETVKIDKTLQESLSNAFENLDFKAFGKKMSETISSAMGDVTDWVNRIDWAGIGKSIGDFIVGIDWGDLLLKTGDLLLSVGEAVINVAKGIVESFAYDDKTKLGKINTMIPYVKAEWFRKDFKDRFGIQLPEEPLKLHLKSSDEISMYYEKYQQLLEMYKKNREIELRKYLDATGQTEMWSKIKAEVDATGKSLGDVAAKYIELSEESIEYLNSFSSLETTNKNRFRNIVLEIENAQGAAKKAMGELTNEGKGFAEDQIELNKRVAETVKKNNSDIENSCKTTLDRILQEATDGVHRSTKSLENAGEAIGEVIGNGIIGAVNKTNERIVKYTKELNEGFETIKTSDNYYKRMAAIKKMESFNVAYLAKGGVIPPNAPFAAVLGDQKHGTNIEAPLETIKQALREVLGGGNGGGNTYNITATANGKTLFQLLLDEGRSAQMQTGKNPFLLA